MVLRFYSELQFQFSLKFDSWNFNNNWNLNFEANWNFIESSTDFQLPIEISISEKKKEITEMPTSV